MAEIWRHIVATQNVQIQTKTRHAGGRKSSSSRSSSVGAEPQRYGNRIVADRIAVRDGPENK